MRVSAELAVLSTAAAAIVAVTGYYVWTRLRRPKDPERYRRFEVDSQGRIIEGTITDVHDGHIYYSWSWRGVVYEASQDVRAIEHLLPPDAQFLVGQTSIKFLPRNPHNSIVISENWNGFRPRGSSQEPAEPTPLI